MIYDVFVDYVLEPALARALLAARYVRNHARKGGNTVKDMSYTI